MPAKNSSTPRQVPEGIGLSLRERLRLIAQVARVGLAWLRHDIHYPTPVPENDQFLTAFDAAGLIKDGDVLAVSGLGAHQRASILYWAIRERFERRGTPRGLTVINVGGHGGRGLAPGTLEELGRAGLCTRFITSHFETFHSILALAEAYQCELQCLPLGVMTLLFDALGSGRDSIRSRVGLDTFLDPRVGPGSRVTASNTQLIRFDGQQLRYQMPRIDVALFNAPAADRVGNIYDTNAAVLGESVELARAARRNCGKVIVNVGRIVPEGSGRLLLSSKSVDGIVYHPDTEQTGGILHRDPWLALTPQGNESIAEGLAQVRFINSLAPVLRSRSAADVALMRVGAAVLLATVPEGAAVSIGTGLPEEVPAILYENGLLDRYTFMVETGVIGGLPIPGLYFGAALRPKEIVSSAELFKRCGRRLDAACLGALEFDADGNVNVSRRGSTVHDYVGPGGFVDFSAQARCVVFLCGWMHGGQLDLSENGFRIVRPGAPKLVPFIREVTFAAERAVRAGHRIFYVTHAGIFERTHAGVELRMCMPGIDVKKDIVPFVPRRVLIPKDHGVPLVPLSLLNGQQLRWRLLKNHLQPMTKVRRPRRPRSR